MQAAAHRDATLPLMSVDRNVSVLAGDDTGWNDRRPIPGVRAVRKPYVQASPHVAKAIFYPSLLAIAVAIVLEIFDFGGAFCAVALLGLMVAPVAYYFVFQSRKKNYKEKYRVRRRRLKAVAAAPAGRVRLPHRVFELGLHKQWNKSGISNAAFADVPVGAVIYLGGAPSDTWLADQSPLHFEPFEIGRDAVAERALRRELFKRRCGDEYDSWDFDIYDGPHKPNRDQHTQSAEEVQAQNIEPPKWRTRIWSIFGIITGIGVVLSCISGLGAFVYLLGRFAYRTTRTGNPACGLLVLAVLVLIGIHRLVRSRRSVFLAPGVIVVVRNTLRRRRAAEWYSKANSTLVLSGIGGVDGALLHDGKRVRRVPLDGQSYLIVWSSKTTRPTRAAMESYLGDDVDWVDQNSRSSIRTSANHAATKYTRD